MSPGLLQCDSRRAIPANPKHWELPVLILTLTGSPLNFIIGKNTAVRAAALPEFAM